MNRTVFYVPLLIGLLATAPLASEPALPEPTASEPSVQPINENLIAGWTARPFGVRVGHFMSACDEGEVIGCNEAAWALETSGYSSDRATAEELLSSRGSCPYERAGFSACIQEARLDPMQRLCGLGNAPICRKWGDTIKRVRPEDYAAALSAYIQACKLGNAPACRSGARLSEFKPSLPGADETWLRERGCELGESSECWSVAQWHAKGTHGYTRDHSKYKEVMKEVERLDREGDKRWTRVRADIQKDALERLSTARTAWNETLTEQGNTYCIQHSTGRSAWVRGTIEKGTPDGWEGCTFKSGKTSCEANRGAAPKTMEQIFDSCEAILNSSPAKFEFGFHARPDGVLLSCYRHAENCSKDCGRSLSVSKVLPGECKEGMER